MFTGIVQAVGTVADIKEQGGDLRLTLDTGKLDLADVKLGDSIAVSGCCLTVVAASATGFAADVSLETMRCTALASLQTGSRVNLEKAMRVGDRFGGHLVSGHVDGVGTLLSSEPEANSVKLTFEAPAELARYIAAKGSICVDGTSLTVNAVDGRRFTLNVIPHTRQETIIGDYRAGQAVNLEVDLVARYLERLLQDRGEAAERAPVIDREFLQQHGFN